HAPAAPKGRPGGRYVLGGAPLTGRGGLALRGRPSGVERPVRTLPPRLVMALATVVENVARLRRKTPPVCRELARTLTHGHAYDGSKATLDLGLRYTPIETDLPRSLPWR